MSTHLTPIDVVECLVAPIGELGKIAGLNDKAPYNWRRESQYRAAGDIPHHAMRRIHAHASARKIPLTADHLLWGADWKEIDKLVEGMGKTMPQHLRDRLKPALQTPGKVDGMAAE